MWNTASEITKYYHKWIIANNETKSLRVIYTVKMVIFLWWLKKVRIKSDYNEGKMIIKTRVSSKL